MPDRAHIGLDNPHFQGRLRQPTRPAQSRYVATPTVRPSARYFADVISPPVRQRPMPKPAAKPALHIVKPQPYVKPLRHQPQQTKVLKRQVVRHPAAVKRTAKRRMSPLQYALTAMALLIFGIGIFVTLMTIQTNHTAAVQVEALAKQANNQPAAAGGTTTQAAVPSTTPPKPAAVANYVVAPDLPRYLNIPKLGVHARVLSLGVLSSGALATPNNVFDTGWYNESAKPGQPGAMLIDGHVSSWTSHGVFYGLRTLVPGDTIQVERGDGTVFTYKVVKSQTYDANNVDMQAAVTPVVAGHPGLNLITCTGQVIHGTSEFNQRVIVFAEQV